MLRKLHLLGGVTYSVHLALVRLMPLYIIPKIKMLSKVDIHFAWSKTKFFK